MIGTKYGFITQHQGWGATEKVDVNHWTKFVPFRPYARQVRKGNVGITDFANKDNIFMRWKERFVVPDHRLKDLNGASFAGFYYICFNQKDGKFDGIYFHQNSERYVKTVVLNHSPVGRQVLTGHRFQKLELKHIEDRGCFGALEFR
jgi:glucose-induced degradation protein 4